MAGTKSKIRFNLPSFTLDTENAICLTFSPCPLKKLNYYEST